ncbi:MAG: U32 family peptidase [Thermodesulfobacteriota bacterium]
MQLTLGPILFDWKREEVIRFYDEAAEMAVDRVYIGEVVCVKKQGLRLKDIEGIAEKLRRAGKEVVLSSLAVVSNEDELDLVRGLIGLSFPVEANDMSVFNIVGDRESGVGEKREIIAGPHITTYNVPSIEFLEGIGVRRVVFPVELSRDSLAYCLAHAGIEGEVFAHGKAPLAFSWRCYTSRAYNLTKSACRHDCLRHPDGMVLRTVDREPLFTVNGTSILSARTYTLMEFVEDLREMGVAALRISPQYRDTAKVVDVWRRRLDGIVGGEEGLKELEETSPLGFCNGWYLGRAGMESIDAALQGVSGLSNQSRGEL